MGGFIYIIFRSDTLIMFDWFNTLCLSEYSDFLRLKYGDIEICNFIKYNIPAALWLLSYLLIIDVIWKSKQFCLPYVIFILSMPIIAIISEIFQLFHLIPGIFDVFDDVSYSVVIVLFLLIKQLL